MDILPGFVVPADAAIDSGAMEQQVGEDQPDGLLYDQARELSDEQAGGHGNHWGVFDEDVEGFVTNWIPRALEAADIVRLGATDDSGQAQLVEEGDLRGLGLLYADRAEDAGRAGLLALIAVDIEAEPGQRSNVLWSAYPFFAEGFRYAARIEAIGLHPNRLEARLDLAVAGLLVVAFDPLFYQHRGLYRADQTVTFSLCALAYRMSPVSEQEIVIQDPEQIRAFRARDAWVKGMACGGGRKTRRPHWPPGPLSRTQTSSRSASISRRARICCRARRGLLTTPPIKARSSP